MHAHSSTVKELLKTGGGKGGRSNIIINRVLSQNLQGIGLPFLEFSFWKAFNPVKHCLFYCQVTDPVLARGLIPILLWKEFPHWGRLDSRCGVHVWIDRSNPKTKESLHPTVWPVKLCCWMFWSWNTLTHQTVVANIHSVGCGWGMGSKSSWMLHSGFLMFSVARQEGQVLELICIMWAQLAVRLINVLYIQLIRSVAKGTKNTTQVMSCCPWVVHLLNTSLSN